MHSRSSRVWCAIAVATAALALASPSIAQESYGITFAHGGVVEVESPSVPGAADPLTLECWFRSTANARQPVALISRWSERSKDEDAGSFHLSLSGSKKISFGLRSAAGQQAALVGFGDWSDGQWHHAAASWDGATMRVTFDGREVGRKDLTEWGPLAETSLPLTLGPRVDPWARRPGFFDGFLGGVAIWRVARSPQEILASLRQPAPQDPNLVAYLPLRAKAPGNVASDQSSNARHGRLDDTLARAGWALTPSWTEPQSEHPARDLFCYDLADVLGKSHSGIGRRILVSHESEERIGVLWQHPGTRALAITWIDASLQHHETHALACPEDALLAAGTTDPDGNVYYVVIQELSNDRPAGQEVVATLHKTDARGEPALERAIDVTQAGFNIFAFNRGVTRSGSLRYSRGLLGLILPRTMHRSPDGLRHQGAIAVVFSAKDLSVLRNLGQTSGHSMANLLTTNSKGVFLGIDLGDNYPRGVHLHEFTKNQKTSRVVFTFKTAHATESRNGSPVYDEISQDGKTFYKWSNDNGVYTELGGIVEAKDAYTILFATDQAPDGRVLDNSRAFRGCPDPRNLAMVRVVKNFGRAPGGNEISDVLMARLPRGAKAETGGFFDFGGRWSKQRVVGVTWLTQYGEGESVHAPRVTELANGNTLVLWEKSGDGESLHAMILDARGNIVNEEVDLGFSLHRNRQDRMLSQGGRIHLLASDGEEGVSRLFFFRDEG